MKKRTICRLIIMTLFFISLTGCGSLEKNLGVIPSQNKNPVVNNVFTSSFPEIKLQISQDLKYLGSVQLSESTDSRISWNTDAGANVDVTAYLFAQIDQHNRIAKGVLIRMLVMHGDPSQVVPPMFAKTGGNILESGEMKIIEDKYQYDLYLEQELFTPKEKGLIKTSRVPPCLLVKQLSVKAGFGNKSRIQLLYFEDLTGTCGNRPCGTCLEPKNRTAEQRQLIDGFTERSFASIRFLRTRMVEDTTSRYVDAEPKTQPTPVQPAPAEKAPLTPVAVPAPPVETRAPIAEPARLDAVEKKLEALKRIYERNLITKEDYEKKKAEILNQL